MLERALNDLRNPKTKTAYLQILATFTGADGCHVPRGACE